MSCETYDGVKVEKGDEAFVAAKCLLMMSQANQSSADADLGMSSSEVVETVFNVAQGIKACRTCKQTFPMTSEFFSGDSRMNTGFRGDCKQCYNEYRRRRDELKRLGLPLTPKPREEGGRNRRKTTLIECAPDYVGNRKSCSTCGRTFPATKFYFQAKNGGVFDLSAKCKDCQNASDRARNQEKKRARLNR